MLIHWYCEAFYYAVFTDDSLSYFVVKVLSILSYTLSAIVVVVVFVVFVVVDDDDDDDLFFIVTYYHYCYIITGGPQLQELMFTKCICEDINGAMQANIAI